MGNTQLNKNIATFHFEPKHQRYFLMRKALAPDVDHGHLINFRKKVNLDDATDEEAA